MVGFVNNSSDKLIFVKKNYEKTGVRRAKIKFSKVFFQLTSKFSHG